MAVLRRLLFLLLLPMAAYGQGIRYDNFVLKPMVTGGVTPVSGALITVCTSAGAGTPCVPKVSNIYSDEAMTVAISGTGGAGTTNSDANGNFGFYLAPGSYVVTVTGSGITSYTIKVILPLGQISTNTSARLNGDFFVDGILYSGCPAAVAAAGTVNGAMVTVPGTGPLVNCALTNSENIIIRNLDKTREYCNGDGGAATPPCNAVNYNYDDGNVYAVERHEMTTSHQDLNGVTLGLYSLTHLKNATANGTSGVDGFSSEANTEGTLSGTFQALQAQEADSTIKSTGGTITDVRGGVFYTNIPNAGATAVTNVTGVKALGCNNINAGSKPTNCYGLEVSDQTTGGVGKASGRNYSLWSRGLSLFGYSSGLAAGGFDLEDASNVARTFLRVDSSNNTILTAVNAQGLLIQDSAAGNQFRVTSGGVGIFSKIFSQTAGTSTVGSAANPFGSLFLGTAATNNFVFTPAATAAARTVTVNDPLGNVSLPFTIANGTSAMTTALIAAGACGTTVTTAATGALTTDTIDVSHNAAVTNANGGILTLNWWPTAGNVNFNYCNPTAAGVTPTAMTVNWSVRRP